jgi:hypothetical protein
MLSYCDRHSVGDGGLITIPAYAKASAGKGGEQRNRTFIPLLHEKHLSRMPQQTNIWPTLRMNAIRRYVYHHLRSSAAIALATAAELWRTMRKVQDSNLQTL